jgi:hypothetical protein
MSSEKLDLYQLHKEEYSATRRPGLVDIKPAKYLSITGRGEPGGEEFATRLGALYNVAFTIKMARKFAGNDYPLVLWKVRKRLLRSKSVMPYLNWSPRPLGIV